MPALRRNCSKDPRLKSCVGAKWLFAQISDLTFLNAYGGDGFGKIYISIKDLHRIFGHDPHSLKTWRDKLVETGWIWVREMWPKSEWGITGVCRQPDLFPLGSEYSRQVAKASGKDSHGPLSNGKSEDFLTNGGNPPTANVKDSHGLGESFTSRMSTLHTDSGNPSPPSEGRVHTGSVKDSPSVGEYLPTSEGEIPSGSSEASPRIRNLLKAKSGVWESSLSSSAALPAKKCGRMGEKDWLLRLGVIVGPKEMANWGGRWRNRYRQDPRKAERVLAELASMQRENRIERNAGACANDLWGRFA